MAWREKVAWLTVLAMVAAYGVYFGVTAMGARSMFGQLLLFGEVMIVQLVVVIVASAALAIASGQEWRQAADERDQAIGRRGAGAAYYVLMTGMVLVGVIMPFTAGGWRIVNAALFALVIAEIVRHVIVIWSYRRGWHG